MSFERPNIQKMQGYSYGEQPSDVSVVKLNTNENPYPPSPKVQEVIAGFDSADLRRYPPALANDFRDAAANLHGLNRDNIIATRGGDELLRLLFTTYTDPGDVVAMTDPTYSLYPVLAQIQDTKIHQVPVKPDYGIADNFIEQANSIGAKMTFIVNPHAPSGHLLGVEEIDELAENLNSLLLVDEAYVNFISPEHQYDCLHLAKSRRNVIFLRSMSKGYGLAGLRFGYGIAHEDLIAPMLTKTRDSYNLDAISQRVATAAILDQQYATQRWQEVRANRSYLTAQLRDRGFDVPASEANFVLAQVPSTLSASETYEQLKNENILVRYFPVKGLDDRLRISIGTDNENQQLLDALDAILS